MMKLDNWHYPSIIYQKLQQARSSTESERRKLSSVLSHMTDGVIATDRKGILFY